MRHWIFSCVLIVCFGVGGCYGLKQIYYQGNLLSTQRPIDVLLWEAKLPETTQRKLHLVAEILEFAKTAELSVGGSYQMYVKAPNKVVSYIVQAAEPDQLTSKKWWFPLVGEVPYLGYYHRQDRDRKAEELKAQGYDVLKTGASGFSLLGFLDDPLFSSMLNRSDARLAHLLFHELTHRSFWLKGQVSFNENLAEYVAYKLTRTFLISKNAEQKLETYLLYQQERKVFAQWLNQLKDHLRRLYARRVSYSKDQLLKEKTKTFSLFLNERWPDFRSNSFRRLRRLEWNNARVLGSSIYMPDLQRFDRIWACSGAKTMGQFLDFLDQSLEDQSKPWRRLEAICIKT